MSGMTSFVSKSEKNSPSGRLEEDDNNAAATAVSSAASRKSKRRLMKQRVKLLRKLNAIEQEMEVVELHIEAVTTQAHEMDAQ